MSSSTEGQPPLSRELSASEAALYDRQIRLWGLEAQNRIRDSAVLIVGLGGLGAEVAKNLILAGPKSVTLMDDADVSGDDTLAQFMVPGDTGTVGNRAELSLGFCKRLNPLVDVSVDTTPLSDKPRSFYKNFDLILCLDQDFVVTILANNICREEGIAFIAGAVFGWAGFGFFDFTGRGFIIKKKKNVETAELDLDTSEATAPAGNSEVPIVTLENEEEEKTMMLFQYPPFADVFDVNTKNLPRRLRNSVPRSYFLIRTLLKYNGCEDEVLDYEYRNMLDQYSHYTNNEESTFTEFRLFTGPQLGATCAIVGGLLAQEAIKAISLQGEPFRNTLIYTPQESCYVISMPPK